MWNRSKKEVTLVMSIDACLHSPSLNRTLGYIGRCLFIMSQFHVSLSNSLTIHESPFIRFPRAPVRIESFRMIDVPQPRFVRLSVRRQREVQRKRQPLSSVGPRRLFVDLEVEVGWSSRRDVGEMLGQEDDAQFVWPNEQLGLILLQGSPSGLWKIGRCRHKPEWGEGS